MKEGAFILIATIYQDKCKVERSDVFYDEYNRFDQLPGAAKSDGTRKEFEIYKEWKRSLKVIEKLEKQIKRFRR